jgi:hypothetical protein
VPDGQTVRNLFGEPHRVFRRLLILEGWSHDQAYSPVFS